MLHKVLKQISKLCIRITHRKCNILVLIVLVLGCLFGSFVVKFSNAKDYTLGEKGTAVSEGTKSGNATIWPVTHPVFIVQLYDSKNGMGIENNSYNKMVDSIKTVIPYASNDAMWLCSNKLSEYLIGKNYHTTEQVYLARKTSETSAGKLQLNGGKNNSDATGRLKYLSKNKTTSFNNNIKDGIFYDQLLKCYIDNNRNMTSLANDKEFIKLLNNPSNETKTYSLELWSYITDVITKGSDEDGWSYEVDMKPKIDQFIHFKELSGKGLDFNSWGKTNTKAFTKEPYELTVGESFNLRYLDLLLTLNAISNNKEYWIKGINSFLTNNIGAANISITQGIVARTDSLATEGGDVKPATVFISCNDLTQVSYKVTASYNLSSLVASRTVYVDAKSTDYIKRLKTAVSLSKSKSYRSTSIYSSAIISRIISERVRSVKNETLVWGSSNNNLNLINLLEFKFDNTTWHGANWIVEPPIFSPLNYSAYISVNSEVYNTINKKKSPNYITGNNEGIVGIDLYMYYTNITTRLQNKVITDDEVNIQLKLKALTLKGESEGQTNAINEWKAFIKDNNIKNFRVRVRLYRNQGGTIFDSVKIEGRDFKQEHTSGESWCKSEDWEVVSADDLLKLLSGKSPIGQWKDTTVNEILVSSTKNVSYKAKVYIQYQAADGNWYYTTGKPDGSDKLIEDNNKKIISDVRITNKVTLAYTWSYGTITDPPTITVTQPPNKETINYPIEKWSSEEPALAYSELKEGSIYNETFEAMAGVPTTRTLYFSSGGNEFMVDLQVGYEHDMTATREYISHYNGTECEYKINDQLKGGSGTYSKTETFVGDLNGKTISKSVISESANIATPNGNSSGNITVNGHTSGTTLWAQWEGTIGNGTSEPADNGKYYPGKAGSPCAGLGYNEGTLRTKAEPTTMWNVDAYNTALGQAAAWAKSMESTNSSYTIQKIADSDGHIRQYQVGDAVITITLTGGSNSYSHTSHRTYSGGTYTSSNTSSANLTNSDKGKLGSGWGWSDGKLGIGEGYDDCGHGHDAPGWHTDPIDAVPAKGNPGEPGYTPAKPAVDGVKHTHKCGNYTSAIDITQGASSNINYTIKVTFNNGTLKSTNFDGNSSDVAITTQTGLTNIEAHALCGPCCAHDLPAIQDVWYQDSTYDTIKITKCNVYKIHKGYVTGMTEITYNNDENLIANITQGDPNIFYNIATKNTPTYQDGKLTNGSKIGRIRYSLQEAQGDKVYYEEMSNSLEKRTNKCDGLSVVQSATNPSKLAKKGHNLGFASGILYSNGKTSGFGNAPGVTTVIEDYISDNKATTTEVKMTYSNKLDSKDLLTEEWKRFYTRRTQEVTATVISDMLILQTSSGDQSPLYYAENKKQRHKKIFRP